MAGIRSTSTRLTFGIAALAVVFAMLGPVGASAAEDEGALDRCTLRTSPRPRRQKCPRRASTSPRAGRPRTSRYRRRAHRAGGREASSSAV